MNIKCCTYIDNLSKEKIGVCKLDNDEGESRTFRVSDKV